MKKPRVFDLFCGAGGSSCGARAAGGTIVGGLDLWDRAGETFQRNYDVTCWSKELRKSSHVKPIAEKTGSVDLLLASPECTNHSVAKGNAPRSEESRETAFQVISFAKKMKPRWIVVENVVSMKRWHAYSDWLEQLRNPEKHLRYELEEITLDAADFGVPQSRRRLFVVADRERPPVTPEKNKGNKVPVTEILHQGTVDNGYSYQMRPLFNAGRASPTVLRANRAIRKVGREESFLLVYYGSDAAGGWQRVDRPLRTITTLDRFALVKKEGRRHVMRMLQPPELAAAMGFPPDYKWPDHITRREHIKLIGNAVAPPVMEAVVRALIS
jgi:DNA (cytosine-5)-methyltransferase 1